MHTQAFRSAWKYPLLRVGSQTEWLERGIFPCSSILVEILSSLPGKIPGWDCTTVHGICRLRLPLKFFRRTVAQRRMQSLLIVVSFDKFFDVSAQVIEVAVLVGVDFLPF